MRREHGFVCTFTRGRTYVESETQSDGVSLKFHQIIWTLVVRANMGNCDAQNKQTLVPNLAGLTHKNNLVTNTQ